MAASDGFMGCGEFQSLCLHVLDGTEPDSPHPLYHRILETYEAQRKKLSFQENNTQLYMLLVFLEDELQAYATECLLFVPLLISQKLVGVCQNSIKNPPIYKPKIDRGGRKYFVLFSVKIICVNFFNQIGIFY